MRSHRKGTYKVTNAVSCHNFKTKKTLNKFVSNWQEKQVLDAQNVKKLNIFGSGVEN